MRNKYIIKPYPSNRPFDRSSMSFWFYKPPHSHFYKGVFSHHPSGKLSQMVHKVPQILRNSSKSFGCMVSNSLMLALLGSSLTDGSVMIGGSMFGW